MRRDHRWNNINGMMKGQKVYILGSGTSLKNFDLSKLDGSFVIAVNHSIEYYPQAPAFLFGDKIFLHKSNFDIKNYQGLIFTSEKCQRSNPIEEMVGQDNLYIYEDRRDEPVENAKVGLFHPTSSGIMALNLAIQMKAKKIYLLGFDYYKDKGKMHFFPDMPHHEQYGEERLASKLKKFKYFEKWKGRIINCNPDSFIEEFQKESLEDTFGKDCYTST